MSKTVSGMIKLDPFLDNKGVIRVGGRLRLVENIDEGLKHPKIIPKCLSAQRLIERFHMKNKHKR